MRIKHTISLFIGIFLLVIGKCFFASAQAPVSVVNKNEILKYREQQDIFSEDLQGLGYSETVKVMKDDALPEGKAVYYYKRGKEYFKERAYGNALVEFEKALECDPQYKPALKYVDLVQEKIVQAQQFNEEKFFAEKKWEKQEEKLRKNDEAHLAEKKKAKHEQLINLLRQEVARDQETEKPTEAAKLKKKDLSGSPAANRPELSKIEQRFENKYIELLKEKEALENNYNKLLEQVKELLEDSNRVEELEALLGRSSAEMGLFKKENEKVKKDYNDLLSQVQVAFNYKQRVNELEGLLEKNISDKNLFEKEKDVAKLENAELKVRVKEFEEVQPKIIKDRDNYKEAYERLYTDAVAKELKVKEFKDRSEALAKKNKDLESDLKQQRDENKEMKKEYDALLTQAKDSIPDKRRMKELENMLEKSAAEKNSLIKERNSLKTDRNHILTQMKSSLADRRRLKEVEASLVESNSDIKAVKKEKDVIRKDYDSLLAQVKSSIIDKGKLNEFEGIIEKNKKDTQLLNKDNETLKAENLKLKNKAAQYEDEQAQLVKSRDEYKLSYEKMRNDITAKDLKGRLQSLEKEKDSYLSQLKQTQIENETVKKDYNSLLTQVNDLLVDKKHRDNSEKENEVMKAENVALKARMMEFEGLQAQLSKDRDEYKNKIVYKNERTDTAKKELKEEMVKLEKEKEDILSELKQTKNGNEDVKKENLELRRIIKEIESQAAKSKEEYKAVNKKESNDALMRELKQAQKENDLIKKDYAALLAQIEKDKVKVALLEKESVKAENIALKDKGYDNESNLKKLKIKEIRQGNINLDTKEKEITVNQAEVKNAQLKALQSKFEAENKQLSKQADEYKKKYLNELEKNSLAMQGANNLPQKFGDVVKKNEELLKETSGMHYNLGVFFIKNKEYDRAIIEFEKAIELYPEDPYSYYNLGYIYAQYLIDRGKAIKYFQQFLQFVKNDDKDVEWVKDYLLTWEAYK